MSQQQPTPEQIKELQEKIAKMSPDELKEFQKKQCIFCHIISGKVQSRKVYEDEHSFAVLDINPANPGHILLMTREHYSIMPQLPQDILEHIFVVAKKLSNALLRAIDARGSNILVANGVAAGQKAQHFMVHIIPRKEKDGVHFELPQRQQDESKLKEIADVLSKALGSQKPKKEPTFLPSIPQKIKEAEHKGHHERKKSHEESQKNQNPSKSEKHDNRYSHQEKGKKPHQEGQKMEKKPAGDINLDDIAKLFGAKK